MIINQALLSKTIRKFVKAWDLPPSEINNGSCGEFSAMVIDALDGETTIIYESYTEDRIIGHCWITFENRHYDAEAPDGVNQAIDLPFFQRLLMAGVDVEAIGKLTWFNAFTNKGA